MASRRERNAISGAGGITADWGPNGLQITDRRMKPHWAILTGQAAGTNRYAHAQVDDADTSFPGATSGGMSIVGTSDVTGGPAYEINGRTDVPADSSVIVKLWPSAGGQYWVFAYGEGSSTSVGFFARLTTVSSGAWKWVALTLNSSGVWIDDGSESASFNAYPSKIDPTVNCNPTPGQRVWMIPSKESGKYEFSTVLAPPLLGEVTAYNGTTKYHTVKQLTWDSGTTSIVDFSPATSFSKCVSADGSQIDTGDRVYLWKIPDRDEEFWITPIARPAISKGVARIAAAYSLTTEDAWENVQTGGADLSLTLPAAGTYRLWYQCSGEATCPENEQMYLKARLYNSTDAAGVQDTEHYITEAPGQALADGVAFAVGNATALVIETFTATKTFKLQAWMDSTSGSGGVIEWASIHYERLWVR